MLAIATIVFAIGAARPGSLGHGRRRLIADVANGITVGGVAFLWLLPAGLLLWTFVRLGLRWADGVAVIAVEAGLSFHPSLRQGPVAWADLNDVRIRPVRINWIPVQEVQFELRGGMVRCRGFDNRDGAAEAFVAAVRERLRNR